MQFVFFFRPDCNVCFTHPYLAATSYPSLGPPLYQSTPSYTLPPTTTQLQSLVCLCVYVMPVQYTCEAHLSEWFAVLLVVSCARV